MDDWKFIYVHAGKLKGYIFKSNFTTSTDIQMMRKRGYEACDWHYINIPDIVDIDSFIGAD